MLVISGGTLHTVTDGVYEGGTLLIDDEGRIAACGKSVEIPDGAEVIDATGLHVFPGFVDAHTHLGIWEEGVGRAFIDANEATDPITPHVRALDALNPRDPGLEDARSAGVTTVCVTPGSANAICGQAVVIKTAGEIVDHMVVRQPAGMKMALGENPKGVYKGRDKMPSTRMGTAAVIREALVDAQNYLKKQARAAEEEDADPPDEDLKLESLAPLLRRDLPARIHAHRADDILTALRLAREFDLDVAVEHCTEGHKVAAELAEAGVPALVGPSLSSRSKVELRELTFATAAALHNAGVRLAIISDHPFLPIQYLPLAGGLAIREGLDSDAALRALTLTPAEVLGVAHRVGSLQPGKDADLAIYKGHPFYDVQARCILTLIQGEVVYHHSEA